MPRRGLVEPDIRLVAAAARPQHQKRDRDHQDTEAGQQLGAIHRLAEMRAQGGPGDAETRKGDGAGPFHISVAGVTQKIDDRIGGDGHRAGADGDVRRGDADHIDHQGNGQDRAAAADQSQRQPDQAAGYQGQENLHQAHRQNSLFNRPSVRAMRGLRQATMDGLPLAKLVIADIKASGRSAAMAKNNLGIKSYFDEPTNTVTHLVSDPASGQAAIIDPVLDYDHRSGKTSAQVRSTYPGRRQGAGTFHRLGSGNPCPCRSPHRRALSSRRKTGAKIAIGDHIGDGAKGVFRKCSI